MGLMMEKINFRLYGFCIYNTVVCHLYQLVFLYIEPVSRYFPFRSFIKQAVFPFFLLEDINPPESTIAPLLC